MKIIGTTKDGFILAATESEVANLVGYYGIYELHRQPKPLELKPGDEIMVHEMFQRLYTLARRRGEIKTARKMLLDAANELELADPIIAGTEEPKAAT